MDTKDSVGINTIKYFDLRDNYDHSTGILGELKDERKGSRRTIIDAQSADAAEIKSLLGSVMPKTRTFSGKTRLFTSALSPIKIREEIIARQEAVRELKENEELRRGIDYALSRIELEDEIDTKSFFEIGRNSGLMGARSLITTMVENLSHLPDAESGYLRSIVDPYRDLRNSDIYKLASGTIFRQGMRAPLHKGQLEFSLTPIVPAALAPIRPISGMAIGAVFGYLASLMPFIGVEGSMFDPVVAEQVMHKRVFTGTITGALISALASLTLGSVEKSLTLPPTYRKFRKDDGAIHVYNSVGKLDEILTLAKFAVQMEEDGHTISQPTIVDAPSHRVSVRDLVNIVQAKGVNYVPCRELDLDASVESLNFITGPNSGGKTSSSKALVQAQILAQMGSYVPVSQGTVSPADRIIYHVGLNDNQSDDEGGFGTQLKKSKLILEQAGPKSLVVIDDLMEGTSSDAIADQTRLNFFALHHTGASVMMITHRYDLADEFRSQTGRGNYLQIEFDGDHPTRQLVPGISMNSRPELVTERIGMTLGGVERLLRERGLMAEGQGLYDIIKN